MKRVFHIDIETCAHCQGSVKIIAAINDPEVIHQILTHLGPRKPPAFGVMRTPPNLTMPPLLSEAAGQGAITPAPHAHGRHAPTRAGQRNTKPPAPPRRVCGSSRRGKARITLSEDRSTSDLLRGKGLLYFLYSCVANLRMSQTAVERYLRVPRLVRATLENVSVLAAQSPADADRLYKLGAPRTAVHVTGSIKFEMSLPASAREAAEVLRGQWGRARPVWLAASTHDGEEELVLAARVELTRRFPDHLLVLVPRHPERFALAARLARKRGFRVALWSERRGPLGADADVLIGDTMGELQLFYGAPDVAFIGGSLVPVGGHNLLEAAAVGAPMVFSPHMYNFEEIASLAHERGAGVQIKNASQLVPAISDFLGNTNRRFEAGERGKKMVDENRGAVARTLQLIEALLPPDNRD